MVPLCRTSTFLTYSGRRSQDLLDSQRHGGAEARGGAAGAADAEWEDGEAEFLDALSGAPSWRASQEGDASAAAAAASGASAEAVAAVRQALAKQQAREVPEEERWAVQVGRGPFAGSPVARA